VEPRLALRKLREDLIALGKASHALLREEHLPIRENVEL